MVENIEFTILMPCLNEEETIGICITKANESIKSHHLSAEVLIADNGSTDNSISIAGKLGARIISVNEKGYGNALKAGIENAKGKYIIMGDSDNSYDFGNIVPFIDKLREGNELVMGNRFKGGIEKHAMPFLHKYFGNPLLSFIGRLFFRIPVGDFHCGLRGFNRQSIIDIDLCTTGMEFASEMVVKSSLYNLKIEEVPTKLYPDIRTRSPHLRTWRDGWRHLRFLLIYSPRWLFLYPGLFMVFFGLILSGILAFQQISLKNIHFDIHTLVYSMTFFLVGYQFVSFFVFTKIFAVNSGLLPASEKFEKLFIYFNLERGLAVGVFLLLLGILLSVFALQIWSKHDFGNLYPSKTLRLVIPAAFSVILGLQTILNSFFLSILGLIKRS